MNQRNHLTDKEITQYIKDRHDPGDKENFESHITECGDCRTRLLQSERRKLGILETGLGSATPSSKCPKEEDLQGFAMGISSPDSPQILLHVANCSYCAPLLKAYLRAAENEPLLVPVPVPVPKPPVFIFRKLLQNLFASLKSFWQRPARQRIAWGGVTALVVVMTWAEPLLLNLYQFHRAENLVAAAFTEVRPNAMRSVWGPYTNFDTQRRGPGQVSISEHPSLAEAVNLAAKMKDSSDPRWLKYRAQVKLLVNEDDASTLLATAIKMGLKNPDTEIDLAVAYFQRDTRTTDNPATIKTPPDLGSTIDLLNEVLREPKLSSKQRAVALFDLAVAYQTMLRWDDAVIKWEEYLKFDVSGPWHDEAQRNLEEAKRRVPPPKPQGYREPAFFLNHFADPDVQENLEEYQDIALRTWLVDATAHQDSEAVLATRKLAELLERQHGDSWMHDFLYSSHFADLPALQALSVAVTDNRHGQYTSAEKHAQEAAGIFAKDGNYPGTVRARFEAVYANQRLLEEKTCLEQAKALGRELLHTNYRWLQVQLTLERAICLNFETRVAAAKDQMARARQDATMSNFRILRLRVQALDASIEASHGCRDTWQQAHAGLEQYWRGPSSPQRLYELYSPLKQCFEKKKLWYAAEALERRMITILEKEIGPDDENAVLQVTAHGSLEQILKEMNEDKEAEEEAIIALRLLDRVERPVAFRYKIPIQLALADLQLDRGDDTAALATIQEAEKIINSSHSHFFHLNFHRVRGDIQLARQQWQQAEDDYKNGLEIAEDVFTQLKKEEQRWQWAKETGDIYRGLTTVLMEQGRHQEALQLWQWYKASPFREALNRNQDSSGSRWPEIEASVPRQNLSYATDTRLVFVSTRTQLFIWAIGRAGMKSVSIPVKQDDLQRRIQQYIQKCSTPLLPVPQRESQDLFSLFLQPVIAYLQSSETVIVDFDSAMNGLPLEALKSPEGWYFGEKFSIIYSPGYLRENDLRQPSQQRPRWGVLVDALVTESERWELQKLFPEVKIIEGANSTPEELSTFLNPAELFVFIGHAASGELVLQKGHPLGIKDFPPQSLQHMQLVVLAACSTGVTADDRLDTVNLVSAFQSGGTPSVIASQWSVDSRVTRELMISFYQHLSKDESVAHALHEARKETIRKHDHPYYWAGFTLSGRA